MSKLDDVLDEIQELKNAKELLDTIVGYIQPNSGCITAWGEEHENALPFSVRERIRKYTKFDDSE